MNKRLLLTDIIITTLGLVSICIVQLLKSINPSLTTSSVTLTSFAVGIILFGAIIMLYSYKNNTDSITKGNLILQAILALVFAACISAFNFADFIGLDYPVFLSFSGLFASRFMFSRSLYIKEHKNTRVIKPSSGIEVKEHYSKNLPEDPSEAMKSTGYLILFLVALFLILLTVNSYYPVF